MNGRIALPAWVIFLLIALGVTLAVGVALLLTRLDTLQQRSLLPQETIAAIDQEATLAASDLTLVVIEVEDLQTATATPRIMLTSTPPTRGTATQTAVPILVPTCAAAPPGWRPIIVAEGETATTLALKYGVSVMALLQANCLTLDQLVPGLEILVPAIMPTRKKEADCGVPMGWVQYRVKPGDTLSELAKRRRTSVLLLVKANCLEDTELSPGRIVFLPPLEPIEQWPVATMRPQAGDHYAPPWQPSRGPLPRKTRWPPTPTIRPTRTSTRADARTPAATASHTPVPSPTSSSTAPPSPTIVPTTTATVRPSPTNAPTQIVPATLTATATASATPLQPTATGTLPPAYPGQDAMITASMTGTPNPYP